jgi:FlaA1/EpsC-like NDP-sugar epimerase
MTIPEAVELVLQAGAFAEGGEIFVLDMGEPVKIIELAEKLIRFSGYEPYSEIRIDITGLRPGEKLYEELLLKEEGLKKTFNEKIFVSEVNGYYLNIIDKQLDELKAIIDKDDVVIQDVFKKFVDTYKHNE